MEKNQLKNLNVYVCSSGTGKSFLAKQNKNYLDMDFLKLKCKYIINDDVTPQNIEYLKGNYNFKRNPDFPENYFNLINSSLKEGKKVLLVPQKLEIEFLEKNNIKYGLFFPAPECAEEYKERFINRGNSIEFTEGVLGKINEFFVENNENTSASIKIILKKGEYITDYLN